MIPQIEEREREEKRVQIVSLFSIDSSPDVIIVNMFVCLYACTQCWRLPEVKHIARWNVYSLMHRWRALVFLSSLFTWCVLACPPACAERCNCFITLQCRVANKRNTERARNRSKKENRCHVKCTWTQMIYFNVLFFSLSRRHFLMIDSWAGNAQ